MKGLLKKIAKRLFLFLCAGILIFSCTLNKTGESAKKIESDAEISSVFELAEGEKLVVPDLKNVKHLGRTLERDGMLFLAQTASGIEFKVENTKTLRLNLVGDKTAVASSGNLPYNYARYMIFVDGKELITGSMNMEKISVTIFPRENKSKVPARDAVVRILKITEATLSNFAIAGIVLDEEASISPTPAKDFKIEFIGDSVTCGYGVEAKGGTFSTQTENATKAYAYLTAENLGADYSIVSYSGFGVYSGYTSDKNERNSISLVPSFYEHVTYIPSDRSFNNRPWDFSRFKPNLIVVNLGTNDASYCKNSERKNAFTEAYVDFLKKLREKNPKAFIICSLGTMGDNLFDNVQAAVEQYSFSTGDTRVSPFHFTPQNIVLDGIGADWHPSMRTQEKAAEALTAYIRSLQSRGKLNL